MRGALAVVGSDYASNRSPAAPKEYVINQRLHSFMGEAIAQAQLAQQAGEVPVGAVAALGDEVIGRGFNQVISAQDPSAHAEMLALREAARRLGNYRLPGVWLIATVEPCTMCAGALIHARVEALVFGAREPRTGAVVSTAQALDNPAANHRVQVVEGIRAKECAALMTAFFKAKRK